MLKLVYDASGNLISQAQAEVLTPQIMGQPIQQIVEPGQAATFSVVVADASGVTFQWKFNGSDIAGATGDTLLLTNVGSVNQGKYSAMVTNGTGSVMSASAELILDTTPISNTSLRPQLTAYSDVGGSVEVNPMKRSYDPGETATLTAMPFAASVFAGWMGDLGGNSNPADITMNASKTVRARFCSATPIPPGVVAFWRGEADASDLIGGHDGAFIAGTSVVAPSITLMGKVGGAFSFDGTVCVRIPDSPSLRLAQVTVELWVFPTVQDGFFQTIIGRGASSEFPALTWALGVNNGKLQFWTNPQHNLPFNFSPLPLNQWTHLAVTFDGSTKRLYFNGVEVGVKDQQPALVYFPGDPITIGAVLAPDNTSSLPFRGGVDEVALYSRALTPNEIFDIYSADLSGKNITQPFFTSPSQLPDAALGVPYTQQLTTILGTSPVSFSVSIDGLPPGIGLSPTGALSGVPGVGGIFDFTVLATDAAGVSNEQVCVLNVL